MKITMHGNPLTLVGTPIKTGETAPVFYGINQQMQPVSLKEFAGKVVVISSFPSIEGPGGGENGAGAEKRQREAALDHGRARNLRTET